MGTKTKRPEPAQAAALGRAPATKGSHQTWVQTERKAHEAWAQLVQRNARAASLLHVLVAYMDRRGALVASRDTLSKLMGASVATVKRAIADLRADNWIEVIQLGGKGGVNAYVVNSRVAWADSRKKLPLAIFTANVIASRDEQERVETAALRSIPTLYPGERQLPTPDDQSDELPDLPALQEVQGQLQLDDENAS